MTRARRAGLLVALALAVALPAGCGVRGDRSPRRLSSADVPYGLLDQAPAAATTTTTTRVPKVAAAVYLVHGDELHPVPREVTTPVTVAKLLGVLLAGPEEDEVVAGLRSAINPAASLLPRQLDPATVAVDLSAEFVQGPAAEQVLGLAQIVFTITEIQGITGVRFSLQGSPIEVPTSAGSTPEPVGRDAFADRRDRSGGPRAAP